MKKRGFTLVELLAVIVILAIIALIAVPVFLGIINNSKKSSDKEGVNLYTDTVEKAIQKKQMSDPNFMPDKCEIQRDGNLECSSGTTSLGTVKVSMKGTKPSSGTIYITEDDITYENIVLNGKTYYEKTKPVLVEDSLPAGVSIGDKYTYKVNDIDTFNFYVLSIEGDKVNIIMDRNICEDGKVNYTEQNNYCKYAWKAGDNNDNTLGPVTAMQVLHNATKNWNNVANMNFTYEDEGKKKTDELNIQYNDHQLSGYKGISISNGVGAIINNDNTVTTLIGTSAEPLKARMPKESEIIDAGCTRNEGSCPIWLVENLQYWNGSNNKYSINNTNVSGTSIFNIYGYWFLTTTASSSSLADGMYYKGLYGANEYGVKSIERYGIRPVITVPLSDLN